MRFVLDTNILVAALRSRRGASAEILSLLPLPDWELVLSVPLFVEYQAVLSRPGLFPPAVSSNEIWRACSFLVGIAHRQYIHFLWREVLPDKNDEMVLELAVAAGAAYIVTHNVKHFGPAASFGIQAIAPKDFLRLIRKQP